MTDAPSHRGLPGWLAAGVAERGADLAFGAVRTVGGVDLVPVAFVTYGFGATESSASLGTGGGGGGCAIPMGAFSVTDGRMRFHPNSVAVLALLVPLVGAVGLAGSRVVAALRQPP